MTEQSSSIPNSRRDFIKTVGGVTAASALSGVTIPHVFGQDGGSSLQVALVGCGGRGSGAAAQAMAVKSVPTKLVAMADVSEHNLNSKADYFAKRAERNAEEKEKFAVTEDTRFLGFDGYKKAMDVLNPGDIVILTTPLAFRWVHFGYAIERGLNVFMEKPLTADAPTSRKMLELSEKADAKGLKVGVGLMVRHCRGRQELFNRIQDGEIGDIIAMRAYRMHGPVASAFSKRQPTDKSELMYQIDRFHSFLWASGGLFNDFYIHQIDECCWMKNKWPIKASAIGGRQYRGVTDKGTPDVYGNNFVDQNLDTYGVEYTFDDGTKFFFNGRTMFGCQQRESSHVHGSKRSAIVSTAGHTPGKVRIFDGHLQPRRGGTTWAYPQPEENPYQLEWDDLVEAIRDNKPYNEVPRGVQASMVSSMGRRAAHTGQEVKYEDFINDDHEFAPDADKMTFESEAPLKAYYDGRYPVPQPGVIKDREYGAPPFA